MTPLAIEEAQERTNQPKALPMTQPVDNSIITLWILRLLIPLGCHHSFIRKEALSCPQLAKHLGLDTFINQDGVEYQAKKVRNELQQKYLWGQNNESLFLTPRVLSNNIQKLSLLVGLNAVECKILEFVILCSMEPALEATADLLGELSTKKALQAIAVILNIKESEIRKALSINSALESSGLVSIDREGNYRLESKLDILSLRIAEELLYSEIDPIQILREHVVASPPPTLQLRHYNHISDKLNIVRLYLKSSLQTGRKGVNILIYGTPGTGKTQLTKALAKAINVELFEVANAYEDGSPAKGESRLRAYQMAQKIFSHKKSLLVFDEIEDVFGDGTPSKKSCIKQNKAWLNRMLEENAVPTLWVSNSIWNLDSAYIRRFDMVIEVPIPRRKQRRQILSNHGQGFLSNEDLDLIADSEHLAPAVVARAAKVVSSVYSELGNSEASKAFKNILNGTLEGQGYNTIPKVNTNALPSEYDFRYINADTNMTSLSSGLIASKSGRLCLYGPPGTGKTAYGRWLAKQMDMPLLIKRGSDLISKWVGETERNIAKAFNEAEQESALLLIDEVDSFLQDRRNASNSWEVSGVNEMLTQMESYSGMLITSTNLLVGLDQAALRRFDLKVKFDCIKPNQAWSLLNSYCAQLGIKVSLNSKEQLSRIKNLTPGDFASVMRRNRFQAIASDIAMIEALKAECSHKEGASNGIGFIS